MDSSDSHLSKCTVIRSFASSLSTCTNAVLEPTQIFVLRLVLSRFKFLVASPIKLNFKPTVPLNPITYGGGGLFGPDHQIIDHNSKTALSSTSKLGDFLFLSIRHTLAEF